MLDDLGVPEADRQRVLTEASIVQREAGTADDFGKVARVIKNRLAIGMKLEMDSTSQYGIGQDNDGSVWSRGEALGDDNPWNTYLHAGLPVGPIANPGRAAVGATLNPTPGDWLYFVAINLETGESRFNETYAGHEADTQVLREWCAENPGLGCLCTVTLLYSVHQSPIRGRHSFTVPPTQCSVFHGSTKPSTSRKNASLHSSILAMTPGSVSP